MDELLDVLWAQRGKCYYSGVAMCWHPNSHWRMSLERLDNDRGYIKDNVALVACEFNTSSQWSKQKVMQIPTLRKANVDVDALIAQIQEARGSDQRRGSIRGPGRKPNAAGEWPCRQCGTFKPQLDFARKSWCKGCIRVHSFEYNRTLRGNVVNLLSAARKHSKRLGMSCILLHDDLLDILLEQEGRCYYSGVPMECRVPRSHWRMSLERLENGAGYTRTNCVLVALEFNTSDFSKNKNVVRLNGTAQWSREKVDYVWGPIWPQPYGEPT